jgi:hypothetical protein
MSQDLLSPSDSQNIDRSVPRAGAIVHVRQRLYVVEEVVPANSAAESSLAHLSCIEDDAQGQVLDVLWEKELDAEIKTSESWHRLASKGFDPARLFAAYLNTLRWNCVTSTDPKLLQSPFRAGIKLDPYQLEPPSRRIHNSQLSEPVCAGRFKCSIGTGHPTL